MYIYKSSRHLSKVGCFSLSLVCILKTVFREYLSVCPLTLVPSHLIREWSGATLEKILCLKSGHLLAAVRMAMQCGVSLTRQLKSM